SQCREVLQRVCTRICVARIVQSYAIRIQIDSERAIRVNPVPANTIPHYREGRTGGGDRYATTAIESNRVCRTSFGATDYVVSRPDCHFDPVRSIRQGRGPVFPSTNEVSFYNRIDG